MVKSTVTRHRKIAIIGYGVEGRALAQFLSSLNITDTERKSAEILTEITICDRNSDLKILAKEKKKYQWQLGRDYLKNLEKFDTLYLSPGVSPHLPEIEKVRQRGVKITSSTELFFDLCPAKIIGITGTKGKGTVAILLYQILKSENITDIKRKTRKVYLVGNIGKPAISVLRKLKPGDLVVAELSSFQLQNLKKSPWMAIVLNITADHLDYHKSIKEYFEAKANILRYQRKGDIAIIYAGNKKIKQLSELGKAKKYYFGISPTRDNIKKLNFLGRFDLSHLNLLGKHNLENVMAAILAARLCGVREEVIKEEVKKFRGREHCLEFVREIEEVKYYNDSAATNPLATIAALKSFSEPKILILGGQSKGNDYRELGRVIGQINIRAVILFDKNQKQIAQTIKYSKFSPRRKFVVFAKNLQQVVRLAKEIAQEGDVVLFSPASASFGLFENFRERGKEFKKVVKLLK